MTLCIAAVCQENFDARLVIAFDRKVSSDIWSSETEFKMEPIIRQQLLALFSGTISEARELLSIYRSKIPSMPAPSETLQRLREPLRIHKRRMIESLVGRRLGLTYEQFLSRAGQIDETVRVKISTAIDELCINVNLLIAGFYVDSTLNDAVQAQIFRMRLEDVEEHHNFACIGAGDIAADFTLHRRAQRATLDLDQTIYNVYEAMRLAQIAPSVGGEIEIMVLKPAVAGDGKFLLQLLAPGGKNELKRYYDLFGPKAANDIVIPRNQLVELEIQIPEITDALSRD